MFWEDLREPEFRKIVKETEAICIIPLGAVERHGPHLPLGTDVFNIRHIAKLATDIEPAVIYPYLPFGLIAEASHYPGTIVLDGHFLMQLLDNICKDVARNGFKKIIILNGHGTNPQMLEAFTLFQLKEPRDYAVYIYDMLNSIRDDSVFAAKLKELFKGHTEDGHAGNFETSMIKCVRPGLVDMDSASDDSPTAMKRLPFLQEHGIFNSMFWYADYPYHYSGDPSNSSKEAGEWIFEHLSKKFAAAIKAIREDKEVARLMAEFYGKREH